VQSVHIAEAAVPVPSVRYVSLLLGLAVLGSLLLVVPRGEKTHADAAVVMVGDFGCGLVDGQGQFVFSDENVVNVVTDGNSATIVCRAEVSNTSGTAQHFDFTNTGELCGIYGADPTADWHETVSAAGQATLVCRASLAGS
jgi:hypothetical protein